jgi:Raf kinase inhibitor-like YbhB/YbcL family protein
MPFNITSTAFEYGEIIPDIYTCEGDDISPRLRWDEEPKETVSFALTMEDPDAPGGTFTHWMVYNIPNDCHELEKIIPKGKHLDNGAFQGKNDFGKVGYNGPCPPQGTKHRYFFRIYALKKKLPPESIKNGPQFHQAIAEHVMDEAEYMGKFYRKT